MENFPKRYRFVVAKVEGISISQFISAALLRNWTASIRGINANKLIFGGANTGHPPYIAAFCQAKNVSNANKTQTVHT